jgi:hypothetical protein
LCILYVRNGGDDMAVYGYARVSTDGQSLSAQLAELKVAKCTKIFQEKISGARSDRKQLTRLMAAVVKGDVLVVTRLDRLARSTRDLLNLLGTIAEKGAGFKSLRDTWADTTTAHTDWRGTRASEGEGRHLGPEAKTNRAPAQGSDCPSRSGGGADRYRPVVQCKSQHN